jgi:hypothetical protein
MVACNRCGVMNRPGRAACVHCLAQLDAAAASSEVIQCAEHPSVAATGRCVVCGKLVCDRCGGVINNRAVYCVEHAAVGMAGGYLAPPPKARKPGKQAV